MTKFILPIVLGVAVAGSLGFYGGVKFAEGQSFAMDNNLFGGGDESAQVQTEGEIIASGENSFVIKTNGDHPKLKVVEVNGQTTLNASANAGAQLGTGQNNGSVGVGGGADVSGEANVIGNVGDLKPGLDVTVDGSLNSEGSISAEVIDYDAAAAANLKTEAGAGVKVGE